MLHTQFTGILESQPRIKVTTFNAYCTFTNKNFMKCVPPLLLFNLQVQIKLNPEKQPTVYMAFLTLNDLINQILKLYLVHMFMSVSCIMGTRNIFQG